MCFDNKIAFGVGDWVLWFPTNDTPAMEDALDVCRPMPFPLYVQASEHGFGHGGCLSDDDDDDNADLRLLLLLLLLLHS